MMCHKHYLKHAHQFPYSALLVFLLVLVGCREVNSDAVVLGGSPLEFEPVPQRGIQTQSSSLAAWSPKWRVDFGEDLDAGLDTIVDVDVLGTGLGSRFGATDHATVNIPNPDNVTKLYVQVVFKAGSLSNPINEFVAPDEIVLSTPVESKSLSAGQLHLAPLTDDAGVVVNNTGRVYETELQPASYVSVDITRLRKFGTLYTPRALIIYVFREVTDYQQGMMSAGRVVNHYLHGHSGFAQASEALDIAPLHDANLQGADLEVTFSLAELGSDPRHVTLVAEAGGVRREVTLEQPTDGDEFSRYTLTLPGVPAGTESVTATVISPKAQPGESVWDNGDSVFWHAVNVKMPYTRICSQGYLLLTTQTDVDLMITCTYVDGDWIFIGPEEPTDPITNLHGFRTLRATGGLLIRETSLVNLEGLENVSLWGMYKNHVLYIARNPLLKNLQGLRSQETLFGVVEIVDNASLETLKGLEDTQEITWNLRIRGNPSLRTLEGLEDLTWVGRTVIAENAVLERITDLVSLPTEHGRFLNIIDNPSLDCSLEPQPNFLPVATSSGNLVDCPVTTP